MNDGAVMLAIDTATEQASVAAGDGSRFAELTWSAGREQTTSVLEQIDRCLGLIGATVARVGGIAVTTGPGMFNGLRVGISVAKGLALGTDALLFGVPTLAVTAAPWRGLGRPVAAVAAAGRGRMVWAWYDEAPGSPEGPFRNGTPAELLAEVEAHGPALVVGEIVGVVEALVALPGVMIRVGGPGMRRGAVLLDVAWPRFVARAGDDGATLEPVYLHAPRIDGAQGG